jgi:hypothetical protein
VSKDRARPFSRKHRKYWLPVTGGMVLIGVINVVIGFCSYTRPSDVHEPIVPNVPNARGKISAVATPPAATGCSPELKARIESYASGSTILAGSTIFACTPDRVTLMRGEHEIELEVEGTEIRGVAETLTLPEIPRDVIRAFVIAYPRTIPSSAVKRTRHGAAPVYELGFPPGAPHQLATLGADGTVLDLR